ncbi:MAG: hypothetical protein HRU15_18200 [Planctomycetes bacterium]|nr:hypothetical protein [Planctomycetota bacterium]
MSLCCLRLISSLILITCSLCVLPAVVESGERVENDEIDLSAPTSDLMADDQSQPKKAIIRHGAQGELIAHVHAQDRVGELLSEKLFRKMDELHHEIDRSPRIDVLGNYKEKLLYYACQLRLSSKEKRHYQSLMSEESLREYIKRIDKEVSEISGTEALRKKFGKAYIGNLKDYRYCGERFLDDVHNFSSHANTAVYERADEQHAQVVRSALHDVIKDMKTINVYDKYFMEDVYNRKQKELFSSYIRKTYLNCEIFVIGKYEILIVRKGMLRIYSKNYHQDHIPSSILARYDVDKNYLMFEGLPFCQFPAEIRLLLKK